ncbi:adenosylmethionine--8-amino-7-oxononanoate transaminase [Sporomusa acidovorans]|uniref:Adenosylmethionine-8-amino-7-oxononanoate aminotransferase n=1 Tax=Sporomusa acidovorans (strain ATCC 49682 / DSM 3132 / Mol) TaxID=1123286 RepID=A0ABZ3J6A9_SPOA4|nr:adenosylmethionine--8-amino-7-oxononanoate transaminase [Sporomusa acidovorans]OZC15380.1 adenosylmethionine-8-amino-7-oxononanoate aminotransferase [Sporomusa acidovorans DSM 3132]SDF13792.1 adenosylmethionine-8-amino-7-oxononanoate aminotransferase apoenzyme [Sporomusa acidovorans]
MNWVEKDLQHIWHPCSQMKDYEDLPPIVIDHAQGSCLYDMNGNRYVDVVSSWWCNLLGHCNERVNHAVKAQIDRLEHVIFANFSHTPAINLCSRLSPLLPPGLTKFLFTDNGSSAVEAALKMSLQYHYQTGNPQKTRFMALSNAYHGETVGALSVGGVDLYSRIYKPMLMDIIRVDGPDCYRCPYEKSRDNCQTECFAAAEQALAEYADTVCAFIVEPLVQGAAGMKIYPPGYLKKLRQACTHYHVHLIADEIATGFGRTGKLFACEHASVSPDILCLSKGLTGGYLPMALAVTTQPIYEAFYADYSEGKAFLHSHTYSGNPLACSAANAVLSILQEERILETAAENAKYFRQLINDSLIRHKHVGEIRSIGLINAIELVADRAGKQPFASQRRIGYQIYKKALTKGVLLRPLGDVLYFNPPLTISREEMDFAVRVCRECICDVLE